MEIKVLFDALANILDTSITLYGFTFTLLDIVLYIAFVGLCCFILGGLLR